MASEIAAPFRLGSPKALEHTVPNGSLLKVDGASALCPHFLTEKQSNIVPFCSVLDSAPGLR